MRGGTRRLGYAGAVLALSAALTACGATAEEPVQEPPRQPSIAEQQQAVDPTSLAGYSLSIPSIGVRSSLINLGLNGDGTISVPPLANVGQAGLYEKGPKPGEVGPAVILCHVNGGGKPGCGAKFAGLRPGDVIDTGTPRGNVRYTVYDVRSFPKSEFPSRAVYSNTDGPELRLVTCGPGPMDSTGSNYLQQTVVWAKKSE